MTNTEQCVTLSTDSEIAVVTVNNPPVNALSQSVRAGLHDCFASAMANNDVKAIVLHCEGRTFMAGADIKEFGKPPMDPALTEVISFIEASAKPVVAAIHGTALGGGFETALGCHYRIANTRAKVGLPEVMLGILPGAGGTQRVPRLVGVEKALDMMISGKPVNASNALDQGLIDEIVDTQDLEDLKQAAIAAARRLVSDAPPRRISELETPQAPSADFFANYRASIAKRTRGLFSPERIVQSVENSVTLPFAEGMKAERELFTQCVTSPQSAGLRHTFFASREVNKVPWVNRDTPRRPVDRVGIVGAGTMGGGIAMNFANAGIPVTIVETTAEALDRGLATCRSNYEASANKGRITQADVDQRMGLLHGSTDLDELSDADLIIEAVFENMDVKKQVFRELDRICKPGAILATNTSTLDVDEIAASTNRPVDVLGLHFFSPANVMRLLEIVRGEKTADDALATCMDVSRKIGKTGVVSGVCFGFIGNRMLEPYLRESNMMLLEGVSPDVIDKSVYDFGFAMGPNAMGDLAGLDVPYKIREGLRATGQLNNDARYGRAVDALVELGRFGQKTGSGIYRYEPGSRTPHLDETAAAVFAQEASRLDVAPRSGTEEEIFQRLIFSLINEGARVLEEGIALRPADIDTVYVSGYGFPAYRGGPMFYADQIGLPLIRDTLKQFASDLGNEFGYWDVAPLLDQLANTNTTFSEWSSSRNG